MKKTTYFCDRCGEEIATIVFTVTCYAEDLRPRMVDGAVTRQNCQQNQTIMEEETRHLCRQCKDAITDGIFIV